MDERDQEYSFEYTDRSLNDTFVRVIEDFNDYKNNDNDEEE